MEQVEEAFDALKAELRQRIREFAPTVQESFEAFDVNGDGVISRTEFKEALVLLGMDVPDAERKRLRQQIDTTPDKKISFKDFEAFMLDGAPVEATPAAPIEEPKPAGLEQPMADGEYDITGKPLPGAAMRGREMLPSDSLMSDMTNCIRNRNYKKHAS